VVGLESPWHLLLLLGVALLCFGPKRLPGMARSLGSSLREFKDSLSGTKDEFRDALDGVRVNDLASEAEPVIASVEHDSL
jgi:TatA/E family protein of Tat protein translocase